MKQRLGITVILSSHILSEVEQIADHIGTIANGKLWYQEPVQADQDLESLFMDRSGYYNFTCADAYERKLFLRGAYYWWYTMI